MGMGGSIYPAMKILKWIAIVVVAVVLLVVGVGYTLPSSLSVEESTEMPAVPEVVFQAVSDLELWQEWEPWGQSDDSMTISWGEKRSGLGASYSWTGDETGTGSMKISGLERPRRVEYELFFNGDEANPSIAVIEIAPLASGGSRVTWSFSGDMGGGPIARYFTSLVEGIISAKYAEGLENLTEFTTGMTAVTPEDSGE